MGDAVLTADSQPGHEDEEAVDNCPQKNLNRLSTKEYRTSPLHNSIQLRVAALPSNRAKPLTLSMWS